MISIPAFSSVLLLLAFLFLSVDGRSTTPWNRRLPSLAQKSSSVSSQTHLMLPQIRGGESSDVDGKSALPTPVSERIGEKNDIPSITGGQILRAGDAKAHVSANVTSSKVQVETFVTKDKPTKKVLKRHKQIAKKLKVRIVFDLIIYVCMRSSFNIAHNKIECSPKYLDMNWCTLQLIYIIFQFDPLRNAKNDTRATNR